MEACEASFVSIVNAEVGVTSSSTRATVTQSVGLGSVSPTATVTMPYLGAVVAKARATWGLDGVGSGGVRVRGRGRKLRLEGCAVVGWVVLEWLL